MCIQEFERIYGRPLPADLADLYKNPVPIRFELRNEKFVVEVQYFLHPEDQSIEDIEKHLYAFAMSSDGFKLLIDLSNEAFPILQNEFGDIDSIGVTLKDLSDASTTFYL